MNKETITYKQMINAGFIYVVAIRYKKRIDTNSMFDIYTPFKRLPTAIKTILPLLEKGNIEEAIISHIKKYTIVKHWVCENNIIKEI